MGGGYGNSRRRACGVLWAAILAALCALVTASSVADLVLARGYTPHQPASPASPASPTDAPQLLYAQQPCTPVYAAPSLQSTLLTDLPGGADVTPLELVTANGQTWQHIQFWSGIDGYIQALALAAQPPDPASEGSCPFPGVPDPQSNPLPDDHGPWPIALQGTLAAPANAYLEPSDTSLPVASLSLGARISATRWASDAGGRPWYQVTVGGAEGWVWAGAVRIDQPNPATARANGVPVWQAAAGKGMWFTNYLTHHTDVNALVSAARAAGLTHLYAEVAITQYGFYGANSLDRLLPVAHKAGIAVFGWVYPTLKDVASDALLTKAVWDYVTPAGDHVDGLATDVEEVDDSAAVYTYGQLVRALVGPAAPLVAAVFHPAAQAYYPYAAVAASWNVIAPMDYWHGRANHTSSPADVRRFVTRSLTTVQAAMALAPDAAPLPLEELGQMYDMYTEDGTGAHNAPTPAEITADLDAARAAGCIGASYFEWQTATQAEWQALAAYQWPAG